MGLDRMIDGSNNTHWRLRIPCDSVPQFHDMPAIDYFRIRLRLRIRLRIRIRIRIRAGRFFLPY